MTRKGEQRATARDPHGTNTTSSGAAEAGQQKEIDTYTSEDKEERVKVPCTRRIRDRYVVALSILRAKNNTVASSSLNTWPAPLCDCGVVRYFLSGMLAVGVGTRGAHVTLPTTSMPMCVPTLNHLLLWNAAEFGISIVASVTLWY